MTSLIIPQPGNGHDTYPVQPTSPNLDGIPDELKAFPQWVGWTLVRRGGKIIKKPISPRGGHGADVTNPRDWTSFSEAVAFYRLRSDIAGVGFVLTADDPYVVVDFDGCRNATTGDLAARVRKAIAELASFTEESQSRTGLHAILRVDRFPESGNVNRALGIETYWTKRFVAFTGCPLPGFETIHDRTDAYFSWHRSIFRSQPAAPAADLHLSNPDRSDDDVLASMYASKAGSKIRALMDGDTSGYPSPSEADGALAMYVCWQTVCDAQALRIIQRSGLWDRKWGRRDYQERTLSSARAKLNGRAYTPAEARPANIVTMKREAASNCHSTNASADVANDPCQQRVAELEAQVAALQAENARLRAENTAIIETATNPNIKAESVTLLRLAADLTMRQREGEVPDADGYYQISPARLGEDFPVKDGIEPMKPIRGKGTILRHLRKLDEFNLLDLDVRPDVRTIKVPKRDKATGEVMRRPTGEVITRDVPIDETWVRVRGRTMTEILHPFTQFRRPDDAKTHGGHRPKKAQPTCQECGGTEFACISCGAILPEEETATPSQFQDETVKYGTRDTPPAWSSLSQFQDETRTQEPHIPPEPPWLQEAPPVYAQGAD